MRNKPQKHVVSTIGNLAKRNEKNAKSQDIKVFCLTLGGRCGYNFLYGARVTKSSLKSPLTQSFMEAHFRHLVEKSKGLYGTEQQTEINIGLVNAHSAPEGAHVLHFWF